MLIPLRCHALFFASFALAVAFPSTAHAQDDPALWAQGGEASAINWYGNDSTVTGAIHSNGGIQVHGRRNSVVGQTTWVSEFTDANPSGPSANTYDPPPVQVTPRNWPLNFQLADYQPGGAKAIAVGSAYVDLTEACSRHGKVSLNFRYEDIPGALYWIPCEARVAAERASGSLTIVSTHRIHLKAKNLSHIDAFVDGILAITSAAEHELRVTNVRSTMRGYVVAEHGPIFLDGSEDRLECGVYGNSIKITGFLHTLIGRECSVLPNASPMAFDDNASTLQGEAVDIDVLANDSDPDGTLVPSSVQIVTSPANGTAIPTAATGIVTYTPAADFVGTDSFQYTVADDLGAVSDPATVTVNVAAPNNPPVADNAFVTLPEDGSVSIQLTASDPDGDTLDFVIVTQPVNGSLISNGPLPNKEPSNAYTYTPAPDFFGEDRFTFEVSDGQATSAATINLTVEPVNDLPIPVDIAPSVMEDSSVGILLDAVDVDGDVLSFAIATPPANGALSGTAPDLVYTPVPDFFGSDTFAYTVSDGTAIVGPVTVNITVTAANDTPTANAQSVTTDEDTPLAVVLSGNDVDGDTLSFVISVQPVNGALSGTPPNLTYSPNLNFAGIDSFTFFVNDGIGDSAPAIVSITVNAVNDAPVADSQTVSTAEDTAAAITLSGSDADGDTLDFRVVDAPTNGTLTGSAPNLTYQPDADFSGTDAFTFVSNDGVTDSPPATVSIAITSQNDPPVAESQSVSVDAGAQVAIVLSATDVDGDSLTFAVGPGPSNGVLSGTAPDLLYTPDAGFSGNDSFQFTANDGVADSLPATVSISVTDVNEPPVIISTPITTASVGVVYSYDVDATDANGDEITYALQTSPTGMAIEPATGAITWTPGAAGNFDVVVLATDLPGASTDQTFTIAVADNAAPVFTQLPLTRAPQNQIYRSAGEVVDPDGDALTIELVSGPSGGVLNLLADGRFELTWLAVGTVGSSETFVIRATDTSGAVTEASIDVTVTGSTADRSHLGRDFWLAHVGNFAYSGLGSIPINSDGRLLQVMIGAPDGANGLLEIENLFNQLGTPFSQAFNLQAGEVAVIDLPDDAVALSVREGISVATHVTSDTPIVVAGFNWGNTSTDSWLAIPTPALGTRYQIAGYEHVSASTELIYNVIAVEDGITNITVTPEAGGVVRQPDDAVRQITMSVAGETQVGGTNWDTGVQIVADRPIVVYSGSRCSVIPQGTTACDHLVEQITPIESLASDYIAAPLATRVGGALYRVFATEDDTAVTINGTVARRIDDGEMIERFLTGPVAISATRPVLAMQYSPSNTFDSDLRGEDILADPFMLQLAPVDAYLSDYTFVVPDGAAVYPPDLRPGFPLAIINHYVGITVRQADADSLVLDGVPLDSTGFEPIGDTGFLAGSIEVAPGAHRASANGQFGLVLYGFGPEESYGHYAGLSFPPIATDLQLAVTPSAAALEVGGEACFDIVIDNLMGERVPRARYFVSVAGVTAQSTAAFADDVGAGRFCYTQLLPGTDTITISVTGDADVNTVEWTAASPGNGLPPVILSEPAFALHDPTYVYDVQVVDPNGDDVTVTVSNGPPGMMYDNVAGQLVWTPAIPDDRVPTRHAIEITATDTTGLSSTQAWELDVFYPVSITAVSGPTTFTGVLDGTVTSIGGDPTLLNARISDGPAAGSSINWTGALDTGFWGFGINLFDVTEREAFREQNHLCRAPGAGAGNFQVQRIWTDTGSLGQMVVAGPVNDTNQDGVVDDSDDIHALAIYLNTLTLTNLTTRTRAWQLTVTNVGGFSHPAIANLDDDIEMEFVVPIRTDGTQAITPTALDTDGSELWKSPVAAFSGSQGEHAKPILVADLENDGTPEILVGPHVLDSQGQLLWEFDSTTTGGLATTDRFSIPVVADLDGDGLREVLYSNEVRRSDGSLFWSIAGSTGLPQSHAAFAVADLDGDSVPEVVATVSDGTNSNTTESHRVFAWTADGTLLWGPVPSRGFSSPAIADFDGDGETEVFINDNRMLISADGRIEATAGASGSGTIYHRLPIIDLNGDGVYERLQFQGRDVFFIYDLLSDAQWNNERTRDVSMFDEPLHRGVAFVDSNHDGSLEILASGIAGTALYESANRSWFGSARSYAQFVDLEQPLFGVDQLAAPLAAGNLADIWVGELASVDLANGSFALSATVRNRGMAPVTEPMTLQFYRGSAGTGTLIGETTVGPLGIAETVTASVNVDRSEVTDVMGALVILGPATSQCESRNDEVDGVFFEFELLDLDFDYRIARESFLARPQEFRDVPVFTQTVADATVTATDLYATQMQASVTSVGDSVRYTLLRPTTLGLDVPMPIVNTVSGDISWRPTQAAVGTHTFTAFAHTLQSAVSDEFTITVLPRPNVDPVIVSTPPTLDVAVDETFSYTVLATDADNDPLTYLLTQAPAGMSIGATSGVIDWTPAESDIGVNPVTIAVGDGFGGIATQSFDLTVQEPFNNPPDISSTPAFSAKTGFLYSYQVVASDTDGDPLTYSLTTGPAGMSVDATGLMTWTPTATGTADVVVRVSDGRVFIEQGWTITITDGALALDATLFISPQTVELGETVFFTLIAENTSGELQFDLIVDGNPVPMDASGQASFVTDAVGLIDVSATLTDSTASVTRTGFFTVTDPGNVTDAPFVSFTAPDAEEEVTSPTDVIGTVTDDNLSNWTLSLQESGRPNTEFIVLAQGTNTFTDAVISQIDPTLLLNGLHQLILQAEDLSGNVSNVSRAVRVTGDMKVGNFSITFEDISVPVAGIPVSVTRTYDSRQRNKSQDFGFGWTVDYQNVRIQESRDIGFSWIITQERFGLFGQTCVRPNGNPTVTVTLPDGEVETFVARAEPECSFVAQPFVNIVFEPTDFTDSALQQTSFGLLRIINNNLVDPGQPDVPVDPTSYQMTTADGMIFDLDQDFGIRQVTDSHGNTLTYSDAGISHSDGFALQFVRDSLGRISRIDVPDGTSMSYGYDANGDLASFTDQVLQRTNFTYVVGVEHFLQDIIDPRGTTIARNEYDDDGRLIAQIDADGNRIQYTHNIAGRTETIRDRRGNTTTYIYDDDGNVLSETNALGETILRTYDANRNVLTETNPLGFMTTMTYDERGNELTREDALGNVTTSTYDDRNLLFTQIDPLGNVVITNSYDVRNTNLLTFTDALDNETTFHWDSGIGSGCSTGASRGVTNALGDRAVSQPICAGPLGELAAWQEDERGVRTTFQYDSLGRRTRETTTRTDENGVVQDLATIFSYDDKGRIVATTNPLGGITTTQYNQIDKKSTIIDPIGRRTEMDYDARGNLVQIRYPDGTSEIIEYDPNDNVIAQTDRDGRITHMVYDAADRLIETVYPDATPLDLSDNPRSFTEYDAAGRVTAVIDERGNRTEFEYDEAGRQTLIRNALGEETRHEYEGRGLRTATIDALGRRTDFVYDAASQLTDTIHPDGVTDSNGMRLRNRIVYDAVGRKVSETDPAGEVTRFEYDGVGNLTAVIDALNHRTEYNYDEQRNKIRQIDAENRTTQWTYDNLGREISRILPLGQSETFGYDAVGNRNLSTDFNGVTTTYIYDDVDRQIQVNHGDGRTSTMTYTGNGQIATATDARGTTSYTYDERSRLARIAQPDGRAIDYSYDGVGNRISLTTTNQLVVYGFDALNRLVTVNDASGETNYAYDAVGNRAEINHANGTRALYNYDALNRLTELVNEGPAPARNLVGRHTYTLGDAGNRIALDEMLIQQSGGTITRGTVYTYDPVYRLIGEQVTDATNGNRTTNWTYDQVGNRLTQAVGDGDTVSYVYDANDRLMSETLAFGPVTTYTYDDNGNTLTKSIDGVLTASYDYDSENRMIQANVLVGTITTSTLYQYDVNGIRQNEVTNGITRTYLVDPNQDFAQVIEEGDNIAGTDRLYTYGDDLINQSRITNLPTGEIDVDVYMYDGLGSTRALTSETAEVTDTYIFEAFGETDVASGSTENKYLYTGEQFDPNVGFYYLRARYMNPSIARFQNMDAFAGQMFEPVSLHKYLYAHANPITNIDPSGNVTLQGLSAGINALAINLSVRVTIFAFRHPRISAVAGFALSALLPSEMVAGRPSVDDVFRLGTRVAGATARQLVQTAQIWQRQGSFVGRGIPFEEAVEAILGVARNTTTFIVRVSGATRGGVRPDFVLGRALLEVKTSGGAITSTQAQRLGALARDKGKEVIYLFFKKPPQSEIDRLAENVRIGGPDVVLKINYLFP